MLKLIEAMQVVVLSSNRVRAKEIGEAARAAGRSVVQAASIAEFKAMRTAAGDCIVLLDLDHFGAAAPDVLGEASRHGAPSLVISNDFDSAQWIRLFQLGASDVLREPISASELHRSIESAARSLPAAATLKSGHRWYSRAWNWGRKLFRS